MRTPTFGLVICYVCFVSIVGSRVDYHLREENENGYEKNAMKKDQSVIVTMLCGNAMYTCHVKTSYRDIMYRLHVGTSCRDVM